MKLTDLEGRFMQHFVDVADKVHGRTLPDGTIQWGGFPVDCYRPVESIAEADGVWYLCPKCFVANGGAKGTHRVATPFAGRNCPLSFNNGVRWEFSGTGLHDLTTTPSIQCYGGCEWHGYITNGDAK